MSMVVHVFFRPVVSFLEVGLQVSRVDMVSDVVVDVAIVPGSKDLDRYFGNWKVFCVPHWH